MEKKEVKVKADTKPKVSTKAKVGTKSATKTNDKPKVSTRAKVSTKSAAKTKDKTKDKPKASSKPSVKKAASPKSEVKKIYATGKRKTSIAKVWMMNKGSGKITINGKNLTKYFQRPLYRMIIEQPFKVVQVEGIYDIECQVLGGGLSGQAGAIKHGISKTLNQVDEEFHSILKSSGFLTRDSRRVERKKYGQPKARKKFQFSKR